MFVASVQLCNLNLYGAALSNQKYVKQQKRDLIVYLVRDPGKKTDRREKGASTTEHTIIQSVSQFLQTQLFS